MVATLVHSMADLACGWILGHRHRRQKVVLEHEQEFKET